MKEFFQNDKNSGIGYSGGICKSKFWDRPRLIAVTDQKIHKFSLLKTELAEQVVDADENDNIQQLLTLIYACGNHHT